MAKIVRERESLGEFFVEPEGDSYGTGHLRDFDRVGQAIAKVIGQPGRENLCLTLHAPESARMDDAVAVALQIVTVRVGGFRIAATAQIQRHRDEAGPTCLAPGLFCELGGELIGRSRNGRSPLVGFINRFQDVLRLGGIH